MDRAYSFGGIAVVIAVAIVCASAAPRARPEAPPSEPGLAPPILATDLIGETVHTPDGEAVGEIGKIAVVRDLVQINEGRHPRYQILVVAP